MLEILKDYGKSNITPAVIARVLGMMAQTSHSNALLDGMPYVSTSSDSTRTPAKSVTSWDSKVLASALQTLVHVQYMYLTCVNDDWNYNIHVRRVWLWSLVQCTVHVP